MNNKRFLLHRATIGDRCRATYKFLLNLLIAGGGVYTPALEPTKLPIPFLFRPDLAELPVITSGGIDRDYSFNIHVLDSFI